MTHPQDLTYRVDDDTEYELQWTMSEPITPIFFTTNIGNLVPGVYNYTMVAEDIWGNVATDMLLVTITPIPFLEAMLPWLIVIPVVAVIVIVVVVLLRKRRLKKEE
jgi:hypothetical protein